jgi:hypothetical protein
VVATDVVWSREATESRAFAVPHRRLRVERGAWIVVTCTTWYFWCAVGLRKCERACGKCFFIISVAFRRGRLVVDAHVKIVWTVTRRPAIFRHYILVFGVVPRAKWLFHFELVIHLAEAYCHLCTSSFNRSSKAIFRLLMLFRLGKCCSSGSFRNLGIFCLLGVFASSGGSLLRVLCLCTPTNLLKTIFSLPWLCRSGGTALHWVCALSCSVCNSVEWSMAKTMTTFRAVFVANSPSIFGAL